MTEWTKLETEKPVPNVLVSVYDEETGRYAQPRVAYLKTAWVTPDGAEFFANSDDVWMHMPSPPADVKW